MIIRPCEGSAQTYSVNLATISEKISCNSYSEACAKRAQQCSCTLNSQHTVNECVGFQEQLGIPFGFAQTLPFG